MGKASWTRWAAGLAAIVALAFIAAWASSQLHRGATIHFWLDDATGLEPGTVVNLSGVRAGVVTAMALDADPARQNAPRAKITVTLTEEAAVLVNPRQWLVTVTTSPLPGFKAEVAFEHCHGELEPLPDGGWHSGSHSAIAKQMSQAFDALLYKLRELSGNRPGEEAGDELSLRDLFVGSGEGGEDRALIAWMLNQEQVALLTSVLRNMDALTAEAVKSQEQGGLAHAALGSTAHANLVKATGDLAGTAALLRSNLDKDGALLRLFFTPEECKSISDMVANMEMLSARVNVLDLAPVHKSLQSAGEAGIALEQLAGLAQRLTAPNPDGSPGDLETQLARLPAQLNILYESVEKTSLASEEVMDQTTEVMRKANLTLSSINQLLVGLKRSWFFRGAFNEALSYDDLAPFLVPSSGGSLADPDAILLPELMGDE